MNILPEPLSFEWDHGNKDKNFIKHEVTNQESEEVFTNDPLIIIEDQKHSHHEQRYQGLGKTSEDRKLFFSFVIRKNKVRIISIRDMNRKEEAAYEKFETNSPI